MEQCREVDVKLEEVQVTVYTVTN
uniref:Uncharacterized protein n=1 Tax=Arundo donax TaxID=35708 RepID=A0A0A8YE44_ARUDO